MFKNKSTGELLCFETDGLLNWEGISHKDLDHLIK